MFRGFILPVILMGIVGGPLLYVHHQHQTSTQPSANVNQAASPWQSASFPASPNPAATADWNRQWNQQANQTWPNQPTFPSNANQVGNVNSLIDSPARQVGLQRSPMAAFNPQVGQSANPAANTAANSVANVTMPTTTVTVPANSAAWNQPGMMPDFAKAETLVFPGDANGPDLTAAPMSFVPTMDLASLFRFDISKNWVTSRWDRVSTSPVDDGLHGMRVALVTGTNSWDLHGALTYFFDANHQLQRITYRGWTGDASRLLQVLQQQHGLRPQPTHWAGLYLSKRSGVMMKHPAVIDKSNPVQQLGLVLEVNNPRGNTPLSADFQSLLQAAMATR